MSLARVKNFVVGEAPTATDLNAEFSNILNNALSLVSPLPSDLDAGGHKITGLAAGIATGDAMRYEQNVPATQAEMEAGASLTAAVVSGRQQYHPSACKAWAAADYTGTRSSYYNVASVTDVSAGYQRFNWTVAFSAFGSYTAVGSGDGAGTALVYRTINNLSTDYAELIAYNVAGTPTDGGSACIAAFGDQA